MEIDWQTPFVIAFEVFMFGLGWLLVLIIVAFFAFLSYAIVASLIRTIKKQRERERRQDRNGIVTFDKK